MNANTEQVRSETAPPIEHDGELEKAKTEEGELMEVLPPKTLEKVGDAMKTPSAAAAIAGAVVLGAATVFGVLETTIAGAAAYGAYRIIRRKRKTTTAREQVATGEQQGGGARASST
jgi:hypothetical protein